MHYRLQPIHHHGKDQHCSFQSNYLNHSTETVPQVYKMDMDNYNKLLRENITKKYKKAPANATDEINQDAKSVAAPLPVADRMDVIASKNAFITLKDHTDNFASNPKCKLINPAKTEIGIISKKYLENINQQVGKSTALNQWRNTNAVIE